MVVVIALALRVVILLPCIQKALSPLNVRSHRLSIVVRLFSYRYSVLNLVLYWKKSGSIVVISLFAASKRFRRVNSSMNPVGRLLIPALLKLSSSRRVSRSSAFGCNAFAAERSLPRSLRYLSWCAPARSFSLTRVMLLSRRSRRFNAPLMMAGGMTVRLFPISDSLVGRSPS